MIEQNDAAMLAALDRLVARYGPRSATCLAELIRDPRQAEVLASALETAAARTPRRKSSAKSQKAERVGMSILDDLRLSDPEKHSLVAEIRRQLIAGTILQSMDELRKFARMHDLSIGKASSRNAAIAPFLKSLSQLPTPEIAALRDSVIHSDVNDRSLESWRRVIVRSHPSETGVGQKIKSLHPQ